jgi:hypothetical protein
MKLLKKSRRESYVLRECQVLASRTGCGMWTAFNCFRVETTDEIFEHPNGPSVSLIAGEFSNERLSDCQLSEEYPQRAVKHDVTSGELITVCCFSYQ